MTSSNLHDVQKAVGIGEGCHFLSRNLRHLARFSGTLKGAGGDTRLRDRVVHSMVRFSRLSDCCLRYMSQRGKAAIRVLPAAGIAVLVVLVVLCPRNSRAADRVEEQFGEHIEPLLEEYCYACHGLGMKKGGVALDKLAADGAPGEREQWWAVLKNVRAGIMPPAGKPRPSAADQRLLADWIKYGAFGIDSENPDPGRITVRRLNRTEYRNTIRDLMGVDYDTNSEFPPDDSGHGFDNNGDVLTMSPLLLEKYIAAAKTIVSQAVPVTSGVVAEHTIAGRQFRRPDADAANEKNAGAANERNGRNRGALSLSYYEPATVSNTYQAEPAGHYQLVLNLTASERYVDGVFDYNKCRIIFKADGEELLQKDFSRQDGRPLQYEFDRTWQAGEHELTFEIQPLTPDEKQVRSLAMRINSVVVRGPMGDLRTKPANYERFFPRDVPESLAERRSYARDLLGSFAKKAFRRPVDEATVNRLAGLAESIYSQDGRTFEAGLAQSMVVILASPRFLFREEGLQPGSTDRYPPVDEYALASRLSYFLWSTMPDEELFRLAEQNQLRANLSAQAKRMLADPRSEELIREFVGQWLQARDIETVLINAMAVISRDQVPDPAADRRRARFRELARKPPDSLTDEEKKELAEARATFFNGGRRFREFELTGDLRQAMRRETEMLFEHIVKDDRSLLELLDCNYTYLNERLAKYYGIEGVSGNEMRLVTLPPDSPRGGVLTQGTVLAVTSNPDRTSPVKRGLFILDNILGTPTAPPPPNIPPLEEARKGITGRVPTLRETLELHRQDALCSSCHSRMDPLGLALENFNALGRWRDKERETPIDATAKLITGESFTNVQELKRILVSNHQRDFYRCLSEKMLTYALGRGLDYADVHTVDQIVDRIEKENGSASALLMGIIESSPFQKCQRPMVGEQARRISRPENNQPN
jgi:Protein of unknown function (DUF1592)/Protein of unknown function (DUF1588)/Protein of unknown function (DUF1587)/Protein of unknown function (DUF1585)/Protein of unknown function (DUF1595)/Planctomycete cytochrome C